MMSYMTILRCCLNIQTLPFKVILRKQHFSHLCLRATENVTRASKGLTYWPDWMAKKKKKTFC